MKIRSPSPRPSERYLVKKNTMVLLEEIQVIRWGGGLPWLVIGEWLHKPKNRYDIIKRPKSDKLIFRQVLIKMDQDKKTANLFS